MTSAPSCDHVLGASISDWNDRGFVHCSTLHEAAEKERAVAQHSVEQNEQQGSKFKLFEEDVAYAIAYRDRMKSASDRDVLKENDFLLFCHCPNCGEKLSQGELVTAENVKEPT